MKLEFAELHAPLFLGGKNHGMKLFSERPGDPDLNVIYNEELRVPLLQIKHNGKTGELPISNVVSWTRSTQQEAAIIKEEPPQVATTGKFQKTISAQVSSPTMHVFGEGPGHK